MNPYHLYLYLQLTLGGSATSPMPRAPKAAAIDRAAACAPGDAQRSARRG